MARKYISPDDVLICVFYHFPEDQREFVARRSEVTKFLHGLQEEYPVLRIFRFRDRGCGEVTSGPIEQSFSNFMCTAVLSTRGWFGDPYRVTETCVNCYENFSRDLFTEEEAGQLEEISRRFFEEFGVKSAATPDNNRLKKAKVKNKQADRA